MDNSIADLKSNYHDECRTLLAHHDGRSLTQAPRNLCLQESVNLCAAARLQFQPSCASTIENFSDAQYERNLFSGLIDEPEGQEREVTDELWEINVRWMEDVWERIRVSTEATCHYFGQEILFGEEWYTLTKAEIWHFENSILVHRDIHTSSEETK